LRAAGLALLTLLLAGGVAVTTALAIGAPSVAAAYAGLAPGFWSGAGATLLALAYLPNAVVAGVSWVLGPGIAIGTGTASVFAAFPPAAPSTFPLLTVLPSQTPPAWTLVVLLAPVAAGVLAGRVCRRSVPASGRVPAASVAIAVTVVTIGLLCALSGGRLAAGAFDPVTVPAGLAMASVLLLVGVPALLVAGVTRRGEPDEAEWTDDGPIGDVEIPRQSTSEDVAPVEPAKPRTVAELVAQRERQAEEAAAAAAAVEEETAEEDEPEVAEEPEPEVAADPEPADQEAGNVVSIDRKRRRT
jgi:hypothetical protein